MMKKEKMDARNVKMRVDRNLKFNGIGTAIIIIIIIWNCYIAVILYLIPKELIFQYFHFERYEWLTRWKFNNSLR